MGRTKRLINGVGLGYVNQLLVTLTGLWLTPFLLARIGPHDYGLWLVGLQVMAYLALLDIGVVLLLPRETAFASGRAAREGGGADAGEMPRLVGQTARLVLWQMPAVALLAAAVWLSTPAEWEALRRPLGVALAAFVLLFPFRVFQAVLQGLQDLAFLVKAQTCVWLLSVVTTVALILAGFGLYALVAGWVIMQLLAAPILWLRLKVHFPGVLPDGLPRLGWRDAKERLGRGLLVSAGQVAVVMLFGTDLLIIGKLLGPAAVVPFACTAKLISVLANQPQMLMQAAGPALAEMRVSESRERVADACAALGQAMLLISGGIVCVVLVANRGFVGWWVGAENYGGFALTALILLSTMLRHWNLTVAYPLFFFGHDRHSAVVPLLDGATTVAAIVLFVWLLGPVGAPLGSIAGVCLVGLPLNLWRLARETGRSPGATIAHLRPWLWRFLLVAGAAGLLASVWTPRDLLALALAAGAVGGAYALLMLPLVGRTTVARYLPARVTNVLARVYGVAAPGRAA